jgi:D-threonine aldolase
VRNLEKMPNIQNINQLDSPALIVFPEIVKNNIKKAIEIIGDVNRLRPHIKTHKTAEVIKLCQAQGIEKYKCATIAEAELLGICEAKDVLLAYQPVGPKAFRLKIIIEKYPKTHFACLVDSAEMAEFYSENRFDFDLYIDLNIGQNRTGIFPENALELAKKIKKLPFINFKGIHAYDGHIYTKDLPQRKIETDICFEKVEKLKEKLAEIGYENINIIAGGSPTFTIHAARPVVECSPGTFVFWDKGYLDICTEQSLEPAIQVVTRIISMPSPTKICTDLGHKSIAAENSLERRVFFPNAQELKFVSQSEEHLVLETIENHSYKIGDILFGIPIHICPTVALYERLYVVEKEQITGEEWKVLARDRNIGI